MHLAALLFLSGAQAQPAFTIDGDCPGAAAVDVVGLTPSTRLAVISGDAPGGDAMPGRAPCAGTATGLSGVRLVALLDDGDGDGEVHVTANLPAGQCGRFVQVVDEDACAGSNVVQLLTGTCEVSGRMALIPGGRFLMGSPPDEVGRYDNETQHGVTLTRSYCIDRTEVTQQDFEAVTGVNPSRQQGCPTCPVEQVHWHDAVRYANAVSLSEGLEPCYSCAWQYICDYDCVIYGYPGYWDRVCTSLGNPYTCEGYRLPTEAEWERAARGGLKGAAFPNGGSLLPGDELDCNGNLVLTDGSVLDDVAWFCGNMPPPPLAQAQEVGRLLPNAYGVYDMSGNVSEWCHDRWHGGDLAGGEVIDPFGLGGGGAFADYVPRGGHMVNGGQSVRNATRIGAGNAYFESYARGLRLARSNP